MTLVASEMARHGMVREALTDVFMDRAAWTHARLQSGRDLGVELHEETITQDLQLDISAGRRPSSRGIRTADDSGRL
jgi:hypothetical protein